jgi:hypothetical protein
MDHVLTKSGFLVFSQLLPARFDTMPSPQLARLAEHDCTFGDERFAEQDSIDVWL